MSPRAKEKEVSMNEEYSMPTSAPTKRRILSNDIFQRMLIGVVLVLLVLAILAAGYFYKQYRDIKKNPQKVTQEESKTLIAAVGKLIVLPQGEDPTIATVTDPAALKDQPFFASAQKDDKVLIFANARKAVLYRPSTNMIVDVAPINIGDNATSTKK
jgi:hypothetical protein